MHEIIKCGIINTVFPCAKVHVMEGRYYGVHCEWSAQYGIEHLPLPTKVFHCFGVKSLGWSFVINQFFHINDGLHVFNCSGTAYDHVVYGILGKRLTFGFVVISIQIRTHAWTMYSTCPTRIGFLTTTESVLRQLIAHDDHQWKMSVIERVWSIWFLHLY